MDSQTEPTVASEQIHSDVEATATVDGAPAPSAPELADETEFDPELFNRLKTVVLYRSKHHGNTKKLIDGLVAAHPEIDIIDVASLGKKDYPDLSAYNIIAFASGIYYGKFDKDIRRIAQECLRDGDQVIAFMTYGGNEKFNGSELSGICRLKLANLLSMYGCPGYDTMGPFKLVGGMNKGRPNAEDVQGAVDFYERIVRDYGEIFLAERAKRDRMDAFNREHPAGGLLKNLGRTARKLAGKPMDK